MQATETASRALHRRVQKLMGNRFELTVIHEDEAYAQEALDLAIAEISRIEALLTTFKDTSQKNQVNAAAGIRPVPVDQEVFELIQRSKKISGLTQGAFD